MIRYAQLKGDARAAYRFRIGGDTPAARKAAEDALRRAGWNAPGWYCDGLIFDISTKHGAMAGKALSEIKQVGAVEVNSLPEPTVIAGCK